MKKKKIKTNLILLDSKSPTSPFYVISDIKALQNKNFEIEKSLRSQMANSLIKYRKRLKLKKDSEIDHLIQTSLNKTCEIITTELKELKKNISFFLEDILKQIIKQKVTALELDIKNTTTFLKDSLKNINIKDLISINFCSSDLEKIKSQKNIINHKLKKLLSTAPYLNPGEINFLLRSGSFIKKFKQNLLEKLDIN